MDRRIIELAIETLEKQKSAIETEIAELKSAGNRRLHAGVPAKSVGRKTRQLSAAAKRAISERMKAYWAGKRAEGAKISRAPKGAIRKPGPQSAAARKAISARMKAYRAKRKAGE